ncbi:N-acyl homoserine lactonase family protein [Kitasatospora sp. MAP5-34]|uniref:N-acyl homoserine lactonase family protein n=1 Tax=Kitasatospora sp. MAP5-34 TaxID=3035102 RepID=UPI002475A37D|nr:N-acyl homoserine lactonase family protein [Kitasatospora sp. MAP5-34]MDH6579946.1 glyoxylase-like metal-dependent hydrolase (beta-lactamase superfamily II) [Kitasatospora sp. MAP5-34]
MAEDTQPTYEVLALRFGTHAGRPARDNFLFDEGQFPPGTDMPMDFYLWVIRNDRHLLLVDTGFPEEMALRRGRTLFRCPVDALADLGITADDVSDIVITHMHYDHAGNLDRFPAARIHLQEAELRFCAGPAMRHRAVRKPFEAVNVRTAIQGLFEERLVLHQGEAELIPGVTVHPVPGHTPGTQVVRVRTARGWVVLAGDATHLWDNIRLRSPFPILDHLASMMDGYDTIEALADGDDHIIPGHDPRVAQRFPRLAGAPDWVRLHEPALDGTPVAAASGAVR